MRSHFQTTMPSPVLWRIRVCLCVCVPRKNPKLCFTNFPIRDPHHALFLSLFPSLCLSLSLSATCGCITAKLRCTQHSRAPVIILMCTCHCGICLINKTPYPLLHHHPVLRTWVCELWVLSGGGGGGGTDVAALRLAVSVIVCLCNLCVDELYFCCLNVFGCPGAD